MSSRLLIIAPLLLLPALGCGPKTPEQKMRYAERLGEAANDDMNQAERALRAIDPDKAERHLRDAREKLSDKLIVHSPESEMLMSRLEEITALLPAVREQKRQADLEEAVRARRSKIGPQLQAVKDAAEQLQGKELDGQKVKAAKSAVDELDDELDDDLKELEVRDEDFASYLRRARGELKSAKEEIALAEQKLEFLAGPIAQREQANERLAAVKTEKDLEKKVALLEEALAAFGRCEHDANSFGGKPELARATLFVGGTATTAQAVAAGCKSAGAGAKKQLDAAKKALAKKQKAKPKKKGKK